MLNTILPIFLAFVSIFLVAIWPFWPIALLYPLIWVFGSYYISLIGGRPERAVGVLAIIGLSVLITNKKNTLPKIPTSIIVGVIILLASYVANWIAYYNGQSGTDNLISLITRMVLFFLFIYFLTDRQKLKWAIVLYIIMGFVAGLYTLYLSYLFGFGFTRIADANILATSFAGPLGHAVILASNELGAPAICLLGLAPITKNKWQQLGIYLGCSFLFSMAFAAQFRREILISIPVEIFFWVLFSKNNKSSILAMLFIWVTLFTFVILPNPVLQERLLNENSAVTNGTEPRIASFNSGLTAFLANPLGYGPGNYEATIYPILGSNHQSFEYHAYNVLIWIAVEGGIASLFGMILIFLAVFNYSQNDDKKRALFPDNWILFCAPALIFQILLWFTFGNTWEDSVPWFLLGAIVAATNLANSNVSSLDQNQIVESPRMKWRRLREQKSEVISSKRFSD